MHFAYNHFNVLRVRLREAGVVINYREASYSRTQQRSFG